MGQGLRWEGQHSPLLHHPFAPLCGVCGRPSRGCTWLRMVTLPALSPHALTPSRLTPHASRLTPPVPFPHKRCSDVLRTCAPHLSVPEPDPLVATCTRAPCATLRPTHTHTHAHARTHTHARYIALVQRSHISPAPMYSLLPILHVALPSSACMCLHMALSLSLATTGPRAGQRRGVLPRSGRQREGENGITKQLPAGEGPDVRRGPRCRHLQHPARAAS
jgi:hypothetical protein